MNDEASMGHSMYGQQIHGPQADGQQRPYPGNAAPQGGMQPPSGPTPPRLKLSWQIWVAVAGVSMVLAMCACAGNLARPSPSPCRSAGEVSCPTPVPTPQDTPTPPDGGAISGMVTWPDGTLAANVRIVLYPLGRLAGYMPEQDMTTDGNGGL